MNRWVIAFVAFLMIVCAAVAGRLSQAAPSDAAPHSAADEIKELQRQRVDLLDHANKTLKSQYAVGRIGIIELLAAERDRLDARLDAAESHAQRISALEEAQKSSKELLDISDARFKNGTASQADFERAKAFHLGAQIKLLRERQAADGEKKK